jgi:hypothetical protein
MSYAMDPLPILVGLTVVVVLVGLALLIVLWRGRL